jgi:NAD(P)-dependent dehydrogenase (short-subunit alcohol dehydrogenase family)
MTDVALVTGAGGALGAEVARTLSQRGDRVVLVDGAGAKARLDQLAASLSSSPGPSACVVAGDVTADATWDEALPRIERELGALPSLAALVAGAYSGGSPLHESDEASWRTMMTANLETVHRSLRRLLPAMVAGRRGSVVVVGSRVAEQPWTGGGSAAYTASKAAVVALAQAVAAEVLAQGVRVNAILPSTMDTPSNRAAMPKVDPAKWVTLGSAAGVIAFLLSDAARDVSGVAVPVYGRA